MILLYISDIVMLLCFSNRYIKKKKNQVRLKTLYMLRSFCLKNIDNFSLVGIYLKDSNHVIFSQSNSGLLEVTRSSLPPAPYHLSLIQTGTGP